MSVRVEILTGTELRAALPELARLRIGIFRAFPYLYEGSPEYEQRYLHKFASAPDAVIVAAFEGGELVGASTAAPLVHEHEGFQAPFRTHGFDVSRIFYFAESVLKPEYRGHGVGHRFFDAREAHARTAGDYTHAAFCAVVRPHDHPERPPDYSPLDRFWRKRGYEPATGLVAHFPWRDIGDDVETEKPMQFWIRSL